MVEEEDDDDDDGRSPVRSKCSHFLALDLLSGFL